MSKNYKKDRLDKNQARKRVSDIVENHPIGVFFTDHALKEAQKDRLTTIDLWNVLKSPDSQIYDEGEEKQGTYRYRLETKFIMLIISFSSSGKELFVITVWDKRKSS